MRMPRETSQILIDQHYRMLGDIARKGLKKGGRGMVLVLWDIDSGKAEANYWSAIEYPKMNPADTQSLSIMQQYDPATEFVALVTTNDGRVNSNHIVPLDTAGNIWVPEANA